MKPTPTLEEVEQTRSAAIAERDRHRDACRRRDLAHRQAMIERLQPTQDPRNIAMFDPCTIVHRSRFLVITHCASTDFGSRNPPLLQRLNPLRYELIVGPRDSRWRVTINEDGRWARRWKWQRQLHRRTGK